MNMKRYINVKQFSMVQRKIITRKLEIKKHVEHFRNIIGHS